MSTQPTKILLVCGKNLHLADALIKRLHAEFTGQLDVRLVHYDDIGFVFEPGNLQAFLVADDTPIETFDVVYLKNYSIFAENAAALLTFVRSKRIPFIGEELSDVMSVTKLSQYARLTVADFPLPKALFVSTKRLEAQYQRIVAELGTPFILKDIQGLGGSYNFLVRDAAHLHQIVQAHAGISFMAQTFIPNDGDLRVLVLGGKTKMIIGRQRPDDSTHLNNTSQGAQATELPLDTLRPDDMRMAERAATLFKRDVAGVDVMFERGSGKAYILEVNAGPQVASGAFVGKKTTFIGELLLHKARGKS